VFDGGGEGFYLRSEDDAMSVSDEWILRQAIYVQAKQAPVY
jgi:hypothetical protein